MTLISYGNAPPSKSTVSYPASTAFLHAAKLRKWSAFRNTGNPDALRTQIVKLSILIVW